MLAGEVAAVIDLDDKVEATTYQRVNTAPALARRPRTQQSLDSLILAGLVLIATLLRLPTLTRAYWVDEGISVGIASHRLSHLPALLHLDGSPPLFYALLHVWIRAFGGSEVSTHAMALLVSLAVIPVAWWSARQFFGRPAALCAAALAATNPFLAWYATETRMYPLVCALGVVALTLVVRALRQRSGRDAVWAVVAFTALVYTHNWGLYLLIATATVLAIRAVRNKDRQELTWIVCGVAAVLAAYLPWLPTFLYQARHTAAPWAVRPSLGDLFADPASVLGGTLGVLIVPLFLCGIMSARSTVRTVQTSVILIFFAIGALTLTEGWVAAQLKPSWASRYLAVGLAPLLVAVAGALGSTKRGRRVVLAASVLLGTWSLVGSLLPDPNAHFAKSNVEAVVAVARPLLTPGDLVLVTQSEQLAVVAHYLPAGLHYVTPTGPVNDPHVVDWRNLIERLATADPCVTVAPELESLSEGAHVLVINPFEPVGASGTRWSYAVNRQVLQVNELLLNDPGLQLDGNFSPATSPEPFSPVTGLLFTKGQGSAPCP